MGLFGRKKRPKEKCLSVEIFFDDEFWKDGGFYLNEFLDEFGDVNDEYDMTERDFLRYAVIDKTYEYTFDEHAVECREDGTVLLSHGEGSSEPLRAVGRIYDEKALDLLRAGSVTRAEPNVIGGKYRFYSGKEDRLVEGEDPFQFRVDIYYRENTP